jgi:hypothetical protein
MTGMSGHDGSHLKIPKKKRITVTKEEYTYGYVLMEGIT